MATKPRGGGLKALVAGPIRRELFCGFPYRICIVHVKGKLVNNNNNRICSKDVECFGEDTCYSLAFGVPAILMGVATIIIFLGTLIKFVIVLNKVMKLDIFLGIKS